jgi:hypothetical protein
MPVERAKSAGELRQAPLVDVLLADEDKDQVLEPEAAKGRDLVFLEGEDVDAVDLRTDVAGHGSDVEEVSSIALHADQAPFGLARAA